MKRRTNTYPCPGCGEPRREFDPLMCPCHEGKCEWGSLRTKCFEPQVDSTRFCRIHLTAVNKTGEAGH